jgi:hypothetical protein
MSEEKENGKPELTAKEEKKLAIKKILKDKLGLSNINEILLMSAGYNGGMFGCTTDTMATTGTE